MSGECFIDEGEGRRRQGRGCGVDGLKVRQVKRPDGVDAVALKRSEIGS